MLHYQIEFHCRILFLWDNRVGVIHSYTFSSTVSKSSAKYVTIALWGSVIIYLQCILRDVKWNISLYVQTHSCFVVSWSGRRRRASASAARRWRRSTGSCESWTRWRCRRSARSCSRARPTRCKVCAAPLGSASSASSSANVNPFLQTTKWVWVSSQHDRGWP